jgi:hypothetical protein
MNAESKHYLIASCSMCIGLVSGMAVLLFTTLAWAHVSDEPQLPTVLFFISLAFLAYGCHRLDCIDSENRR